MRVKLKAPFFYQNHRYDIGEVVDLARGDKGPMRTVQVSHERISYDSTDGLDANRLLGKTEDVPLYDVVEA